MNNMNKIPLKKLLNMLLLLVAVSILGFISKTETNKNASQIIPSAHADEPAPPAPAGDPGCGGSAEGCEGCGSGGCP